jgi:uncharacterized protein
MRTRRGNAAGSSFREPTRPDGCLVAHTLGAMGAETTRLRLRVSPGATRAAVVGRQGDAWKVRVAEAPERGRANEAVLRLLADALALPRTALTLVSGHGAREKIVELTGIGPGLTERRLNSAASGTRERKERR